MLQFDRVTLSFGGHVLFRDASFNLQKGERCGLIGRNGSGKSTLLRLIEGELEADKGEVTTLKNYRIGYLQQHIHFTEPTLIEEAAASLPDKEELYKAEKILFGLGFTEKDLHSSPSQFSGGYHLRLHLAKVLITEPDCLLLDEPTNYLDILSMRWLTTFLSRWKGECILISHDRDFMDKVCTHTMGIHREKVKKIKGSSLNYFEQILLDEEVYEKTRVKTEKKRAHLQSFVDRFGAKATKAAQAQSKKKMLEREPVLEKLNSLSELSFSFQEAPFPGKKILEASSLYFSYTEQPLIENFSLSIEKGERIAIIGKNGRGKSTTLRLLSQDLEAQKGNLECSSNMKIGYFGQTHVERLNPKHTIDQEIHAANPNLNITQTKGIAGAMLFSGALSEKKISVLSGGERSRVLLGKIIANPCNLLLLDEPTHHLDIESIEALIDALEDFSGALVIVTHSELILRRLELDKIVICEEGRQTLFLGGYDDFIEKIGWEEEKKNAGAKAKSINPRQERADWVIKRAAAIKPIEKEIGTAEKKLVSLEAEQKIAHAQIEKGEISPEAIKAVGVRQKAIEDLENQLYSLYANLEAKKQEFSQIEPVA